MYLTAWPLPESGRKRGMRSPITDAFADLSKVSPSLLQMVKMPAAKRRVNGQKGGGTRMAKAFLRRMGC